MHVFPMFGVSGKSALYTYFGIMSSPARETEATWSLITSTPAPYKLATLSFFPLYLGVRRKDMHVCVGQALVCSVIVPWILLHNLSMPQQGLQNRTDCTSPILSSLTREERSIARMYTFGHFLTELHVVLEHDHYKALKRSVLSHRAGKKANRVNHEAYHA